MIGTIAYGILALAVVSSVVQRTWAVFLAAVLLMPLTRAMPEPMGFVLAPINLMLIGMAIRVFGQKPEKGLPHRPLPLRPQIIFVLITMLIGLAIRAASDFQGVSHLLPLSAVAKNMWYWSQPFVFYALTFRAAQLGMDVSRLILFSQASMIFEAGWAMMERLQGASRSTAHLGEDNLAGSYFASGAAFFLAWYLIERRPRRWISFGVFALMILALFATLSRGGLVAAAIAVTVVVIAFMAGAGRTFTTKLGFAIMIALAVANLPLLVPDSVRQRVLVSFGTAEPNEVTEEDVDSSTAERLAYFHAAIELCRENPFGHGAFIFPELMLRERGLAKVAHNIYLTMFVEFGVQGFVAILVLVFATLAHLFRAFRRGTGDIQAQLGLALAGWWTGHVVSHIFLNSFFSMPLVGQFWMMHACEEARAAARSEPARASLVSQRPQPVPRQ